MFTFEKLMDQYNFKARLLPALFMLLPILVAIWTLFPEIPPPSRVVVVVIAYFIATALTLFGRESGRAVEPSLYEAWGGKPSVAMLRHRDTRIPTATKERYRAFLERQVPNLKLASKEEEERSPSDADDGYESANKWLLAKTRDKKRFHLIFEENMNYGFHRNFWALNLCAYFLDILLIAALLARDVVIHSMNGNIPILQAIDSATWSAISLILFHILGIAIFARRALVRSAADAYAKQLLEACDILDSSNR